MSLKEKKYDAFISYRHSELDSFVATTLHKKLESFSVPKNVKLEGKRKIERVFRDEDELPLSANLSDPITEALESTDFLIVICTPRLPESQWCAKEIETFIKLYGREKILAVLAEGEPDESFPKALTEEEYEETTPDGKTVKKVRHFEPLAADVRGKNNKEIKKAMDDAVLRIAASMFGLNYDDLKQRHRERRMKRIMGIMSAVTCAFMLFSAVCIGMMTKIVRQSEMILDQNNEIIAQNSQIEQQNALIQSQYEEASINLAKQTSEVSLNLFRQGRLFDALYALRNVIPDSRSDTSIPYTPETENALVHLLDVYTSSEFYKLERNFDTQSIITYTDITDDYSKFITADKSGYINVFDINTGDTLFSSVANTILVDTQYASLFLDNDTFLYSGLDGVHRHSFSENKDTILKDPDYPDSNLTGRVFAFPYTPEKYYCVEGANSRLFVFNGNDNSLVTKINFSSYHTYGSINKCQFSADGKYLAFAIDDVATNEIPHGIYIYDMESQEIVYKNKLEGYTVNFLLMRGHTLFYCIDRDISNFYQPTESDIYSINCETGKQNWKSSIKLLITQMMITTNAKYVVCSSQSEIYVLDYNTGAVVNNTVTEGNVCALYPHVSDDTVFMFYDDGAYSQYLPENNSCYPCPMFSIRPSEPVSNYIVMENAVIVTFTDTEHASLYLKKESQNLTKFADAASRESINKIGDAYICADEEGFGLDKTYRVVDLKTNETIFEIPYTASKTVFIGDGSQYICVTHSRETTVFDYTSGKELISYKNGDILGNNDGYVLLISNDKYTINNIVTGECLNEFEIVEGEKLSAISEIFIYDADMFAVKTKSNTSLEIRKINNGKADIIFDMFLGIFETFYPCSGNKAFAIARSTGYVDFYLIEGDMVNCVNTVSDISTMGKNFTYYPDKEIYMISGVYAYILDKSFVKTSSFGYGIYYRKADDTYLRVIEKEVYSFHLYTYDELVKMADEKLNGYKPSERIIRRYNITVK